MGRWLTLVMFAMLCATSAKDIAGKYSGEWSSGSGGAGGAFRLALEPGPGGQWKLEVTFSFSGSEVKTTVRSIKVEGARIEASYDFDLAGNNLRSTIQGQLTGETLEGTYKTTAVENGSPVDQGTWKAAPVK